MHKSAKKNILGGTIKGGANSNIDAKTMFMLTVVIIQKHHKF